MKKGALYCHCDRCQNKTLFNHQPLYNFGNSNLGIRAETWVCENCGKRYSYFEMLMHKIYRQTHKKGGKNGRK